MSSSTPILRAAAIVLALFGMVTIFVGGSVIFDLFGLREKEGNFVPFVVWANFICGFIYIATAYNFWNAKRGSLTLIVSAFVILVFTFGALMLHIKSGGLYEAKTI